jgi:hypothetical protein
VKYALLGARGAVGRSIQRISFDMQCGDNNGHIGTSPAEGIRLAGNDAVLPIKSDCVREAGEVWKAQTRPENARHVWDLLHNTVYGLVAAIWSGLGRLDRGCL